MNFLRSVFISAFIGLIFSLAVHAGVEIARGVPPLLSWIGLLLAAGAPAFFFARNLLFPVPRTPKHPVGISVLSGMGVAITMAISWRYADAAGVVHVWSGACLLGWIVYLRWYSVFSGRNAAALTQGRLLPDFELVNDEGQTVRSADLRGKPHILVFYRGNWCPFCTAQLAELAGQYQRLNAMGAEIVLISSQPQSHILRLARRFDAPMQFFHDPGNTAAGLLGIAASWGTPMGLQTLGYSSETALPTVIITASDGHIVWADQTDNYRIRPEPETFIKVLKGVQTN